MSKYIITIQLISEPERLANYSQFTDLCRDYDFVYDTLANYFSRKKNESGDVFFEFKGYRIWRTIVNHGNRID
jgi:hypothetical protein